MSTHTVPLPLRPTGQAQVRVFALCDRIENHADDDSITAVRIREYVLVSRQMAEGQTPAPVRLTALAILDRDGDPRTLQLSVVVVDPHGVLIHQSEVCSSPPTDQPCLLWSAPINLDVASPKEGTYRVLLTVNGVTRAFSPLAFGIAGEPPRQPLQVH